MSWAPLLVTVALIAPAPLAAQPARPSKGELLQRTEAALGGSRALANLKAYRLAGQMEGLSGFPGTYQLLATPAQRRVDWDIRYISQSRAFDGKQAWERGASVRELAGADFAREQASASSFPFGVLKRMRRAQTVDVFEFEGRHAYRLSSGTAGSPSQQSVLIDALTYLPIRESRIEPYENGLQETVIEYGDYRNVGALKLPFHINEQRPDLSFDIRVQRYALNPSFSAKEFENPNASRMGEPYSIHLKTVPFQIYKERANAWGDDRFWGIYYPPSEAWTVSVVVDEALGRYVTPESAKAELYSGGRLVKSVTYDAQALEALKRFPVTRFRPQPEIYHFRYDLFEPASLPVDSIRYSFVARAADGSRPSSTLVIPVKSYRNKHKYIFPIRGNFMLINGHDADELDHKYEWSQQFSYDVVGLGKQLELVNPDGSYEAFGRREVIAPADGTVVYARNDVPDDQIKKDFLKRPDGKWAIGGNIVLIDHGGDEFSLFAHMRQGSVRVKAGDRLKQGDVIGRIGSSGSPGYPHLHYQLQDNPRLFEGDGLPVVFENVRPKTWYVEGDLRVLKRGIYLEAF